MGFLLVLIGLVWLGLIFPPLFIVYAIFIGLAMMG